MMETFLSCNSQIYMLFSYHDSWFQTWSPMSHITPVSHIARGINLYTLTNNKKIFPVRSPCRPTIPPEAVSVSVTACTLVSYLEASLMFSFQGP